MDEQQTNPRRKKPTPMQIFKRQYLPVILMGITAILIVVIIAGSIVRAVQRGQIADEASIAAAEEEARVKSEAQNITAKAAELAADYDYQEAVSLIDGFSGQISDFPELAQMRAEYAAANQQLVSWSDPNSIYHLSFQMLIADPVRAFADLNYADSFRRNYILTTEFSKILEQLYANGYILVNLEDFVATTTDENGDTTYSVQPIRLPPGKTPIILTQTNVNYDTYLVDGNDDGYADQSGSGFASRLVVDTEGKVVSEYIDANGQVQTGNYDLIPILDTFIEEHPDFSYRGAKATIALTGHEGLFGYRTSQKHLETYGTEVHEMEVAGANAVAKALKDSGYKLAYYTYANTAYGVMAASEIQADLDKWNTEVTPIIGPVDTIAFAQRSDISEGLIYSGDSYDTLASAGFNYYLGFCTDGQPWAVVIEEYVRQGRILVGGSNLLDDAAWFAPLFDTTVVRDSAARD